MPEFRIAVSVSTFSRAGIQEELPVRIELMYMMYSDIIDFLFEKSV